MGVATKRQNKTEVGLVGLVGWLVGWFGYPGVFWRESIIITARFFGVATSYGFIDG